MRGRNPMRGREKGKDGGIGANSSVLTSLFDVLYGVELVRLRDGLPGKFSLGAEKARSQIQVSLTAMPIQIAQTQRGSPSFLSSSCSGVISGLSKLLEMLTSMFASAYWSVGSIITQKAAWSDGIHRLRSVSAWGLDVCGSP